MIFSAILIRSSAIYTQWRHSHRVSGEIDGVMFKIDTRRDYIADHLNGEQISKMKACPYVKLETRGDSSDTFHTAPPLPAPAPLHALPPIADAMPAPAPLPALPAAPRGYPPILASKPTAEEKSAPRPNIHHGHKHGKQGRR
jgi:hypothetical protein